MLVWFLQNKEDKQSVKDHMEGVVEKLWRELQQVLHHYNETTKDRFIATESLQIKDEQSAREIDTHKKHIQKLQVSRKEAFFPYFQLCFYIELMILLRFIMCSDICRSLSLLCAVSWAPE